jgi:hypothetical protein
MPARRESASPGGSACSDRACPVPSPIALERLRCRPETGQVIYYGWQRGRCDEQASPACIFPEECGHPSRKNVDTHQKCSKQWVSRIFLRIFLRYRQKHGLTVTGNYSMRDLVEHERMHPAIVRRLDDMCRVIEV